MSSILWLPRLRFYLIKLQFGTKDNDDFTRGLMSQCHSAAQSADYQQAAWWHWHKCHIRHCHMNKGKRECDAALDVTVQHRDCQCLALRCDIVTLNSWIKNLRVAISRQSSSHLPLLTKQKVVSQYAKGRKLAELNKWWYGLNTIKE